MVVCLDDYVLTRKQRIVRAEQTLREIDEAIIDLREKYPDNSEVEEAVSSWEIDRKEIRKKLNYVKRQQRLCP
jgi:hypothetical protein